MRAEDCLCIQGADRVQPRERAGCGREGMARAVSGWRTGAGTTADVAWPRVHAKQEEDAAWSLGARLCGRRVCGALCFSRRVGVADALPAPGGCCGPSPLGGHGGMRGEGFCVPLFAQVAWHVRRICEGGE